VKAVLFDLDGTLIDSVGDIRAALNASFAERGLCQFDRGAVVAMIGSGARTLVARAFDQCAPEARNAAAAGLGQDALIDELYRDFIARYEADSTSRTTLFPGAGACLERLAGDGIRLGIVTNKPQGLTDAILDAMGLAHLFGAVVGASDQRALKPEPDMLLTALAMLDCSAEDAVFVGDSPADSGAAVSAGVPFVLITHGYGTPSGDAALAALTIRRFDELYPALNRW